MVALPFTLGAALVRSARSAIDPFGVLAAIGAVPRLVSALESISRLATPEVIAELGNVRRDLADLADATESLRELASIQPALVALAEAAAHLERLSGADTSLARLADATTALETLARNSTVLPALAAATRNLPHVPKQVEALEGRIDSADARLSSLDRTMVNLDESIAILAEAIGPLQGTTARIGRIVDRLPDRARRRAELIEGE